jgi:hypothetical protein
MTKFHLLFHKQLLLVVFIATILLFSQTTTLLHATEHPFHDHQAEDDIFLGVETQSVNISIIIIPDFAILPSILSTVLVYSSHISAMKLGFDARAPPFIS